MARQPHPLPRNPAIDQLLIEPDGKCWWCRANANTQEHKYKRTDLARSLGADDVLFWGSGRSPLVDVRSIRKDHRVRFQPSLCQDCNNSRSQPFDRAYERYSEYVSAQMPDLWRMDGIPMRAVFGQRWEAQSLNLARYYVKHFGCRMVDHGVPVPSSLRAFLDGEEDMEDGHLALVKLRSIKNNGRAFHEALCLTETWLWATKEMHRITGFTTSNFIGYVGVRFEWHDEPWPHDSFFGHERPILNMFNTEDELMSPPTPRQRVLRSLRPNVRFARHFHRPLPSGR